MSTDSKNVFVFLVDEFSELVHTTISLGCRQLRNLTLLIRLPGTVSNGLSARQLEIFTKMPLKGYFKLLKSIRCLLRNVKRFQNCICFFFVDKFSRLVHTTISLGCRHWNSTLLIRLPGTVSNGLYKCLAVRNFLKYAVCSNIYHVEKRWWKFNNNVLQEGGIGIFGFGYF